MSSPRYRANSVLDGVWNRGPRLHLGAWFSCEKRASILNSRSRRACDRLVSGPLTVAACDCQTWWASGMRTSSAARHLGLLSVVLALCAVGAKRPQQRQRLYEQHDAILATRCEVLCWERKSKKNEVSLLFFFSIYTFFWTFLNHF